LPIYFSIQVWTGLVSDDPSGYRVFITVCKKKIKSSFSLLLLLYNFNLRFHPTSTLRKQLHQYLADQLIYSIQTITMKKLTFLFSVLVICTTIVSCRFHHNTSISYSENRHYYKMKASFSRNKTGAVERYMDDMLSAGTMSFHRTRIDGEIALDDHSTFYIRKHAGYLYIKLDKDENSDEAYYKIKAMCEGIKKVLTQ
jgi:hypothetical protein